MTFDGTVTKLLDFGFLAFQCYILFGFRKMAVDKTTIALLKEEIEAKDREIEQLEHRLRSFRILARKEEYREEHKFDNLIPRD